MASCITSITSILLILVAPACGTLYAQGWNVPNSYWSIDSIDSGTLTFGSTTVTSDTTTAYSISIAYDCTSEKMYSSISTDALAGPYYLQELDPTTGVRIGLPLQLDERISGLEFVNGQLYGWSSVVEGRRGLVKINTANAVITGISTGVGTDTIVGMAYDVCTGTMYGVTNGALTWGSSIVIINLESGSVTPVVDEDNAFNTGINYIDDIAFDDDCELYGVTAYSDKGQLISIDLEDIDNPKSLGYFDALDGTGAAGAEYVTGLANVRDDCGSLTPTASPTIAPTASPTKSPTSPTKSPNYSADGDDDDDDSSSDDDDDSSSY